MGWIELTAADSVGLEEIRRSAALCYGGLVRSCVTAKGRKEGKAHDSHEAYLEQITLIQVYG